MVSSSIHHKVSNCKVTLTIYVMPFFLFIKIAIFWNFFFKKKKKKRSFKWFFFYVNQNPSFRSKAYAPQVVIIIILLFYFIPPFLRPISLHCRLPCFLLSLIWFSTRKPPPFPFCSFLPFTSKLQLKLTTHHCLLLPLHRSVFLLPLEAVLAQSFAYSALFWSGRSWTAKYGCCCCHRWTSSWTLLFGRFTSGFQSCQHLY